MIRERLIVLRERRAHLVALAETQRADTLVMVRRAELATAWFDRAAFYARWLRGQPVLVAVAVALLVALRPAKALKWFGTGISLWDVTHSDTRPKNRWCLASAIQQPRCACDAVADRERTERVARERGRLDLW